MRKLLSTCTSHLLSDLQLFAVSPRRHTTTRRALGVFTEGNVQVVGAVCVCVCVCVCERERERL